MASAVGSRATRSLHWRGEGTTIGEVVAQLTKLHAKVARHEAGDHEHAHTRNCVMNLVTVARHREDRARAVEVADTIARHHPLRAITILHDARHGGSTITAEIDTTVAEGVIGQVVQCENVRLDVVGPAGTHLYSLVEPLLVPDVHTYLWWMGAPPLSEPAFRESLELAEVLVVDSATFERPFISVLELSELAAEVGERIGVSDLQWGRLRPWRELIAQFFSPGSRRSLLDGVNGVGVDYVGEGRGNRIPAALLAGWLASMLGWKLKRAAGGAGGVVVAWFESPREHPVEVAFRSVPPQEGLSDGELAAVRLDAVAGGVTGAMSIRRDPEDATQVVEQIETGENHSLRQVLALENPDEGDLLLRLLASVGKDPVYEAALQSAAELLRALR